MFYRPTCWNITQPRSKRQLPACALPPPLMCLYFHPMAVSRWFSAASLKQVSNMAITGSGSLAISLSVFVISAAFLPKGESPLSFARLARACGCVAGSLKSGRGDDVGGEKLWRVCAPRCAPASPGIAASLSLWTLRGLVAVFNAGFSGLLSWVPAEATVEKSNIGGGSLRK